MYRVEYGPNANAPLMTLNNAAGPAGAPMRYSNGLFLLTIDPVKAAAQWEAVRAAGGLNSTDQSGFSNQDNFEHREKTIGAYGVAAYAGEKLKAQFGLHEDSTQQDTTGAPGWLASGPSCRPSPPTTSCCLRRW